MSASSRRLACLHCVQGKRLCDKARPACSRCRRHQKRCKYDRPPPSTPLLCFRASTSRRIGGKDSEEPVTAEALSTSCPWNPLLGRCAGEQGTSIMRNSQLHPRTSLSGMRYTDSGQRFDLERIFMGGSMSVAAKQQARLKVEAMRVPQFYVALDAARVAGKIGDFAKHIGSNEPILRMAQDLKIWNVVSRPETLRRPDCHRLEIFDGDLTLTLLEQYLQHAQRRPATSVIRAGIRYVELGLPHSNLIVLSLKTNGVIVNAMSAAQAFASTDEIAVPPTRTFLSPSGNALSLLAHEWKLLTELDSLINACGGRVSESAALPALIALVCRHSQLLDHACYRVLAGQYAAAEFFLQQARLVQSLRISLFGEAWPLAETSSLDHGGATFENGQLLEYLHQARIALKGITSKDWLADSLRCWPRKVRDAMESITKI